MSWLVWPALCTGQFVTRGRALASLGKSHSCETPTTSSISPSAAAISVAAGTIETIRLTNDYFGDSGTIRHRQSTNRSLRRSVASLDRLVLRRLRSLPKREIASRRSLWRCCLGGSLGGPSRLHRGRELRTTFWRAVAVPLHLLRGHGSFRSCRVW